MHQMRTVRPRVIVRVNRRDVARQMGHGTPRTLKPPLVVPPIIVHVYDRRGLARPSVVALPEFHVVVLASPRHGRLVRAAAAAPLGHLGHAGGDEVSELARPRAAAVAAEGELAGDFGGEVPEEVGHGDEATADDAGGDFGDAVIIASLVYGVQQGVEGKVKLTSIMRRGIGSMSCRDFWHWRRL